jgi:hypothetical protein
LLPCNMLTHIRAIILSLALWFPAEQFGYNHSLLFMQYHCRFLHNQADLFTVTFHLIVL